VAQFTADFRDHHWKAIIKIFQYIKGTMKYGILIKKTKDPNLLRLRAYCDADHAGEPDRRSYGGSLHFMWGCLFFWTCKKIRNICISVHESELVTMSRTSLLIKWQIRLYRSISRQDPTPVPLFCDNQGAISTAENGVRSRRSKHIDIADLYVVQATQEGWVKSIHTSSETNWSDFLSKPLGAQKFFPCRDRLGLYYVAKEES
jgi:hypothetical protein